jgi:hypothetical protein
MKRALSILLTPVLVLCLLAGPIWAQQYSSGGSMNVQPPSFSDEQAPTGEMILYDLVLVRPVSIVACGIGFVGSLLAMPFSAMSNRDREVSQRLISEPFAYAFTRPLGHFENNK